MIILIGDQNILFFSYFYSFTIFLIEDVILN